MRAIDVARQHDDEVALIAKIVGQPAAIALVEQRQLADEMIAHLQQALLSLAHCLVVGNSRAATADLHVVFEEPLLARAHLDAKFDTVLLGCGGVRGNELIEAVAGTPAPALGAEIAQHGSDHRQSHEALLAVDDLEQPRIAIARLRKIAARTVEQQNRAKKVVRLLGPNSTADPGRGEDILEQLSRLRRGPRIRPLVTGHGKVEG